MQKKAQTKQFYQQKLGFCATKEFLPHGTIHGYWDPQPTIRPGELRDIVQHAESDPQTKIIKRGSRNHVLQATLRGENTLIKRYDFTSWRQRLKYIIRPSRGRRAWAVAHTMIHFDIPTPRPLGFLEIRRGPFPLRSYSITAFLEEADSARKWIKPYYHRQSASMRKSIRGQVAALLLNLYEHGIYHADTKSSNMLLAHPLDEHKRAFYWIDLECVQCGVVPGRHQVIRNLVQLNGSLGSNVSDEDRLAFLHDLAGKYPWLPGAKIERKIRRWTRRRLEKELRRQATP